MRPAYPLLDYKQESKLSVTRLCMLLLLLNHPYMPVDNISRMTLFCPRPLQLVAGKIPVSASTQAQPAAPGPQGTEQSVCTAYCTGR